MELKSLFQKKVEVKPKFHIPFSEPNIGLKEKEYLNKAIDSGWIGGQGEFIDKLEEKFAKYIGVDHAITCSSGTTALMLAYHACGMNGQSKVIVPDNTFRATYNMCLLFTSNVAQIAPERDTWTLSLDGRNINYAIGVHLYGNPVDMGSIYKDRFIFIEDCAQSLGSKFKGKHVGSFGLASCFSLHSAKGVTTGEGGMVCTNSKIIADRVRHLKNHSMTEPYKHDMIGYNGRMTNLQAAIGVAQMERIDELSDKKRAITKFYDENLDKKFIRQKEQRNSYLVKWANAYKIPNAQEVRGKMLLAGIETRPGFIGEDIIVMPCSTKLTQSDLSYVVQEANAAAA